MGEKNNMLQGTAETSGQNVPQVPELILNRVLPLVPAINHAAGSEVVVPGTRTRSVYYVESGSVEVLHNLQGTRITVAIIGQGNFFGEIGFFDGISRVREIRASEDSLIRTLDYEFIQELGKEDPELYSGFITFLARSICAKFRGIVEEREPLAAYAASLSAGQKNSKISRPLPTKFVETKEWLLINQIVESLKADFFDLSHRIQAEPSPEITAAETEACRTILDRFNDELNDFESQIQDPEFGEFAWGFMFKELFPFLMRSRLAERAYYKPKGYAGDYLMMEMIYGNEPKGDGKLGLLMDAWFLGISGARAVRSRRSLLSAQLAEIFAQNAPQTNRFRILDLACGSCRELFDFIGSCPESEKIEAVCMDADIAALEYTNRHVNVIPHRAGVKFLQDNVVRWAVGRASHDLEPQDLIYSVGLTDYLDDRLFVALVNRCYKQLKPGGIFIVGNFGHGNPNRVLMDRVLSWTLIHRSPEQMKQLIASTPFGDQVEVIAEEEGVNLFAFATKASE